MSVSGTALWFCGLPGSGKTTISKKMRRLLKVQGIETIYLSMDQFRKTLFPHPDYSDWEREAAYRALALLASTLANNGHKVIVDATAHKRKWRNLARSLCKNFEEVYVKCPIRVCIERETNRKGINVVRKRLYLEALDRLRSGKKIIGLGKVPGVDEKFEESRRAEIVIDSSIESSKNLASHVLRELEKIRSPIFSNNSR